MPAPIIVSPTPNAACCPWSSNRRGRQGRARSIPAAPDPIERPPRRWALALSGAGALAVTGLLVQRAAPTAYETRAGEQRTVALGGEDRLIMNGQTRVAVAGLDRRSIRLEGGEILLQLREAGAEPIRVAAGDLELVDVGTVFSVARSGRSTRVVVAEGEVVADPAGAKLRLPGGTRLEAAGRPEGAARRTRRSRQRRRVALWATGLHRRSAGECARRSRPLDRDRVPRRRFDRRANALPGRCRSMPSSATRARSSRCSACR